MASSVHLVSKIMTVVLLFVGTLLFGVLPVFVRRNLMACDCVGPVCKKSCRARRGKIVTTFLIYFGGGVLLATCLIHLLPEAREGFEKYSEAKKNNNLLKINDSQVNTSTPTDFSFLTTVTSQITEKDSNDTVLVKEEGKEDDGDHEHFPIPEFVVCCGFFAVYLLEEILHYFLGGHSHVPTEARAIRSMSRSNSCVVPCSADSLPTLEYYQRSDTDKNTFVISQEAQPKPRRSSHAVPIGFSISGLLTVAALSFHSVFEGFAIGLQSTDTRIWILFGAIAVHKFVIAFVVGLEVLATGGRDCHVFIYMSVFSVMSPIGMIAAMITEKNIEGMSDALLVEGILNGIATGTLLYVTFCEILQRSEEEKENLKGWQQFLATILGFGIMCLVQYGSTFA